MIAGHLRKRGEGMDMVVKIVGINARFSHSALALFYVRNELEKHCPQLSCRLYQFTINDSYYETLLRLTEGSPQVILFSAAIWNSTMVERLCRDVNRCLPGCRLVIGGPQAGVLRQRLADIPCTFVLGEIEAVAEVFCRDLLADRLDSCYRGSFLRDRIGYFSFPYRDEDFGVHLAHRHVYYESSRGCPFSCSYCLSAAEKGLYHKDLTVVREELRHILRHRPKVVRFIDRTFNDQPQRALAIWRFLAEEGGETLFHFEMAPDRFSEEMFAFLESLAPGRFQFELGIQSTNIKTLQAVNRPTDSDKAHLAMLRLARLGNIHLHLDLILGLPHESMTSFAESFRRVFAMEPHYIQMGLLKLLPEAPISERIVEYGYVACQDPPYAVLQNRWLRHDQLSELYWFSEVVEKFYNNRYFPTLWRYLRHRREDPFAFFRGLLALCQPQGFFQRAPTQELLCTMLVATVAGRDDYLVLLDVLRFDWLRCGFRFLPDCLAEGMAEAPERTRSTLYQSLPEAWVDLYDRTSRNHFFRKAFFLRLSAPTIDRGPLPGFPEGDILCFTPQKEGGLLALQRVVGIDKTGEIRLGEHFSMGKPLT
jgi:hypothetical protein